jgi:hypothetical protein
MGFQSALLKTPLLSPRLTSQAPKQTCRLRKRSGHCRGFPPENSCSLKAGYSAGNSDAQRCEENRQEVVCSGFIQIENSGYSGLEILDRPIFAAGHIVSGHTLKHLAAAAAGYYILRMVHSRRPATSQSSILHLV